MGNRGFRGYISSRRFRGERAPQHIQNIVIRNYCVQKKLHYLLSATELAMPDSFMMLEQLVLNIETVDGLVFYSLKQLPARIVDRERIFSHILNANRCIHFAVEGLSIYDVESYSRIESIIQIQEILPACPNAGELRATISEFRG